MLRRLVVGVSLSGVLASGLAVLPGVMAGVAGAGDPADLVVEPLEPDPAPVSSVELPDVVDPFDQATAAASVGLPDDAAALPADDAASVPADEAWTGVPGMPVEVQVDEPLEPTPGGPGPDDPGAPGPDAPGDGSNVPADADVAVELTRPEDLGQGVMLLEVQTPPAEEEPAPQAPDPGEPGPEGGEVVPAEGVDVRVAYTGFDQVYGGGWSSRLVVIAYPSCFVATPEEPGCSVGVPVASANDEGRDRLVFTTVPADEVAEAAAEGPEGSEQESAGARTERGSRAADASAAAADADGGVVYAVTSDAGDFAAVPSTPSSSWQVGTGSGEFDYAYPFALPAARGGPSPELSLNYSSGSVDAVTSKDAQSSGVGEGWSDMSPGYITRSFATCADDQDPGAGAFDGKGDLCWKSKDDGELVQELQLVLNGRSSRLVRVAGGTPTSSEAYRMVDDPGWQIERRSELVAGGGPDLVDDDREQWVVRTPDGTQYWFGSRPDAAQSTWTVPVFGNDGPGPAGDPDGAEPCHVDQQMGSSWCYQGWRWNLDRVIDAHGNEIQYSYAAETNYYGLFGNPAAAEPYHRGGSLAGVEYGMWNNNTTTPSPSPTPARQKVAISTRGRCVAGLAPNGSCPAATEASDPTAWPDVPLDQICDGPGSCNPAQDTPGFFTTRRYHQVETSTMVGPGLGEEMPVATYTMGHRLPDPDCVTLADEEDEPGCAAGAQEPALWLFQVAREGHVGSTPGGQTVSKSMPVTSFDGWVYRNRVDPEDANEPLDKFRVFAVRNELGGRIDVRYGHADADLPDTGFEAPPTNGLVPGGCTADYVTGRDRWESTKECFAVPDESTEDIKTDSEWFHKYVVKRVAVGDDTLHYRYNGSNPLVDPDASLGQTQVTDYDYSGPPAWRYVDELNRLQRDESWTDWRGYEQTLLHTRVTENHRVKTVGGVPQDHAVSRVVRFRGMHGSRLDDAGGTWTERVATEEPGDGTHPAGDGPEDLRWLNGLTAETATKKTNGDLIERAYTRYESLLTSSPGGAFLSRIAYPKFENTTTTVFNPDATTTANPREHRITYEVHEGGDSNQGVLAGAVKSVHDEGRPADPADDKCTTSTWETTAALGPGPSAGPWMRAPDVTASFASACGATSDTTRYARSENFYDNAEDNPANAFSRGRLTRAVAETGASSPEISTESDYDQYGRVVETRDPNGERTLTDYNPTDPCRTGEPGDADLVTTMTSTVIQDRLPNLPSLVTTTTMEPAAGLPTTVVDPNGQPAAGQCAVASTRVTYDPLGRPTQVWLPANTTSTASMTHSYANNLRATRDAPHSDDEPARVHTRTWQQKAAGTNPNVFVDTYTFYNGWGNLVETQATSPTSGRRIGVSTGYDDRGQVGFATSAYSNTGTPGAGLINPDLDTVARYSETTYDAAGRPTRVADKTLGGPGFRSVETTYRGDATTTNPPGPGHTITAWDWWERPERTELAHNEPGGSADVRDAANYAYTPAGELAAITKTLPGAAGPFTWTYDYDRAGRKTKAVDPDTGTSLYTYDPAGNLTATETRSVTNPAQVQARIETTYDDLHRPLTRTDTTTGPGNAKPLAAWTYDTATNGLGQPATATTTIHAGGTTPGLNPTVGPYDQLKWTLTKATTAYDDDGSPTNSSVTYPKWLTGEAGTVDTVDDSDVIANDGVKHSFGYTYTPGGDLKSTTYPAIPGHTAFTVNTTFDSGGRMSTMATSNAVDGAAAYVLANTTYNAIGQTSTIATGLAGGYLGRGYSWEPQTGMVGHITGTEYQTSGANPITRLDLLHEYDDADQPQRITATYQPSLGATAKSASTCYDYDGLNRLTRAWNGVTSSFAQSCIKPATSTDINLVKDVTGEVHDLAYTYSGDRLATVRTPGTGTATGTTTYQYANGTPHQTSALTGTGTTNGVPGLPKTGDIGYDGSGRATSQPSQFTGPATNDYDTQGNLVRTASGGYTTTNAYDADGIRIARRTGIGAIQTTSVYLGDTEIFLTATNVKGSTHHFTTPGGTPLANTSSTGTPGWTWTMADAANTTRLTRDPTGAKRYNYYPYGEPTNLTTDKLPNPAITGSRGYLNKPHDIGGDLRLDHRTYTPNLNILTTPDPLLDPADPHTLNPYTYSRHNPTTLADPTGLRPCEEEQGSCGPGAGYVTNVTEPDGQASPSTPEPPDTPGTPDAGCPAHLVGPTGCGGTVYPTNYTSSASDDDPVFSVVRFGYNFAIGDTINTCRDGIGWGCLGEGVLTLPPLKLGKAGIKVGDAALGLFRNGDKARDTTNATDNIVDACRGNSFTGNTEVLMADGTSKRIEDVTIGDLVWATDPETGEAGPRRVTDRIIGVGLKDLVKLSIDGDVLTATDGHPFWVPGKQLWVDAGRLRVNDELLLADGARVRVAEVSYSTVVRRVYNVTVADIRTYHVLAGDSPILVHNCATVSSLIGQDPRLVKEAQIAGRSVQGSIDNLTAQLANGNLNPGIGTKQIFGDVLEARARDGARVYFRGGTSSVEILAKSNKVNQPRVISILEDLYG